MVKVRQSRQVQTASSVIKRKTRTFEYLFEVLTRAGSLSIYQALKRERHTDLIPGMFRFTFFQFFNLYVIGTESPPLAMTLWLLGVTHPHNKREKEDRAVRSFVFVLVPCQFIVLCL